jgi:hypothetical protein
MIKVLGVHVTIPGDKPFPVEINVDVEDFVGFRKEYGEKLKLEYGENIEYHFTFAESPIGGVCGQFIPENE